MLEEPQARRAVGGRRCDAAKACGVCVAVWAVVVGAPRAAAAEANAADWVARSPGAEIGVAAFAVGSLATYFLPQHHGAWEPAWARPTTEPYELISDVVGDGGGSALLAVTGLAMDGGYLVRNRAEAPLGAALRDSVVDVEAVALTTGITTGLKRIVGRCRPRSFSNGHCGDSVEDHAAFPSGHTSPVASIAGARFALAVRSTGDPGVRWGTFGVAEGFTAATMALRMLAGAHSWQDVLGGWAIGTTTGLLVALAHPMRTVTAGADVVGASATAAPASYSPEPTFFRYSGQF